MKNMILAANWKLNKSPEQTRAFFATFLEILKNNASAYSQLGKQYQVAFFPSATSLEATSTSLRGTPVQFGVQNIYHESQGAFTGENSARVVKELGGHYILIGHSERRQYFHETNSSLNKKVHHALQEQLAPMYCIGETLEEREKGQTEKVLLTQITEGLKDVNPLLAGSLVIAYEPVWAIGTGKVATPDQVKETHAFVQTALVKLGFTSTPILYGGSAKASNAGELIQIPHVSGFLVGGASLEPQSFLDLIQASLS
ncbi:MAG: triose-phosphate isomerase [Bdellovibrionaceae bacterium]|nr:triose-phosphate isomerase [Pseudobdellovibrionaceae bacterium]